MKNTINLVTLLTLATLLAASCAGPEKQSSQAGPSFDSTLTVHLNAINRADLAALEPTVADSVILISPTGAKMHSKASFMKLHADWFQLKNWTWEGSYVRTESTDSMGYALVRYTYTQNDSLGNIAFQNQNYLVLIFQKSPQGWQLIHDQNTRIPK